LKMVDNSGFEEIKPEIETSKDGRELSFLVTDVKGGNVDAYYEGDRVVVRTVGNQDAIERNKAWKKRLDELWDRNGYVKVDHGKFTKTYKEWYLILHELTPQEITLANTAVKLMRTGTNILVKGNNKTYYTRKEVIECTHSIKSIAQGYIAFNGLIEKQVLVQHTNIKGDVAYFVNPYMFSNGNYIDKTLLTLFRGYERRAVK